MIRNKILSLIGVIGLGFIVLFISVVAWPMLVFLWLFDGVKRKTLISEVGYLTIGAIVFIGNFIWIFYLVLRFAPMEPR
jgi:hypothetical protein